MRASPWSPFEIGRAYNSGTARVQLIRLPSFETPVFWEVCQRGDEWLLYSSTVVGNGWPAVRVQGYELTAFSSEALRGYFDRLTSRSFRIAPHLKDFVGLDGTLTHLTLFGGGYSQVRFQWWSDPPKNWKPMVTIANEMLAAFGQAAGNGQGR